MKIAFINPHSYNPKIMHKSPPYGILSIISFLIKQFNDKIKIKYYEDSIDHNIKNNIKNFYPDIIAISSVTPTIKRAYELADYFKRETNAIIILGGKHPSVCPYESIQHADYVIIGEGEIGLAKLIKDIMDKRNPHEKIIYSREIDQLDDIPLLPWDILDREYYLKGEDTIGSILGFDKKGLSIGFLTSRGCPFECVFCYNSKFKTKIRYFSPERVIDEIEFLLKKWKVRSIFFFDDEFLSNKVRIKKICELIKTKKMEFNWSCQARAETVDYEILKLIKSCGCMQIAYGFESGSYKILHFLKGKKASIVNNISAIYLTKKAGIRVFGNIILGVPTENIIDFCKTFYFVMRYPIDIVATSILTPYPGTKLWDYCVRNNIINPNEINYEKLSMQEDTIYLNNKYFQKSLFKISFFIYKIFIFLFKKGYNCKEILYRIKANLKRLIKNNT